MAKVVLLVSVFCFSFICLSSAFRHHVGSCPSVSGKQDLDLKKLTGTWVKYVSYGFKIRVKPPKCRQTVFTVEDDNDISMVEKVIKSKEQKLKTSYLFPGANNTFTRRIIRDLSSASDKTKKIRTFTILDTDYNCWAATYECKEKTGFPKISEIKSTLLVRNRQDCKKNTYKDQYEDILMNKLGITLVQTHGEHTEDCPNWPRVTHIGYIVNELSGSPSIDV